MSRTWKREPIRRSRDNADYLEHHYGKPDKVTFKRKVECLIGTLSEKNESGDNTFTRDCHV